MMMIEAAYPSPTDEDTPPPLTTMIVMCTSWPYPNEPLTQGNAKEARMSRVKKD